MVYDRAGDAHYDTISAFIKNMRASDEKGAMYWLAKMLHAGEDFRFIARRIVVLPAKISVSPIRKRCSLQLRRSKRSNLLAYLKRASLSRMRLHTCAARRKAAKRTTR